MPVYRIQHTTTYRHGAPATSAWQTVRLRPRDEPFQSCVEFDLDITPRPTDLTVRTDYHGNQMHVFTVRASHRHFVVSARGLVNRSEPVLPMPALTPDAAAAGALAEDAVLAGSFQLEQFRHPTASIPFLDGAAALVASLDRDVPLLAWMELLGEKFARDFRFDPTATDVSTPLAEVLRLRLCELLVPMAAASVMSRNAVSRMSRLALRRAPTMEMSPVSLPSGFVSLSR